MTSSAIWQLALGLVVVVIMFALAVGARRTVSIGALLVMIPFQAIDTRYASSTILVAYVLGAALLIAGGLRFRMVPWLAAIVLAYMASLALADRSILKFNVLFLFQFFSCLIVFILAYNFAILAENERSVSDVLLAINWLTIGYCALQLSVGPGQRFIPFGIEMFSFNLNRDPSDPRLVGPFDNPGTTAGYFALMTLVCAFEIMFSTGKRRLWVWLITPFNLMGLVATGNRAGFIVLMAWAPVLLYTFRKQLGLKRIITLSVGGSVALLLAATIAVTYTDFDRLFSRMETVTETEGGVPATRVEGWPVAIAKIKRHPWFGESPYFWTKEDAEKIGQSQAQFQAGGALDTAYDNYPHSLYLYLLRTVGIVGFFAVLGFFVRVWFELRHAAGQIRDTDYPSMFARLGLVLIPAFLVSEITLEFHRPNTMDYAQFMFALMGMLVGTSDRAVDSARARIVGRHPTEVFQGHRGVTITSAANAR